MDVRIYHGPNEGEIDFVNGQAVMADGLESAAYLSLFGGNERDSGLAVDDKQQWWGNISELAPQRRYRSETQNLLRSLPATSSNLRRLEDAAGRDLAWFTEEVADSVEVAATIPVLNRVQLNVVIVIGGKRVGMIFAEDWKSRQP